MNEYYLSVGGQNYGPYSLEDLKTWQSKGEIDPGALVWDGQEWKPAHLILSPPPPPARLQQEIAVTELDRFSRGEVSGFRSKIAVISIALTGVAVCLGLYFGVGVSMKTMNAAEIKSMSTMLAASMAQEPMIDPSTGGPMMPPVSSKPKPLPPQMQEAFQMTGFHNKWGHPVEYVSDGKTYRLLLPMGANKTMGYLIGDPFSFAIWYWRPDSGPISWPAVQTAPASAIR